MADIELSFKGIVAEIALNRPDKRNALTLDMWRGLPGLVAEAAAKARAIVVTGRGGAFSAGADIAEFEAAYATAGAALANQHAMQSAMQALETCSLPVLALVDGVCVGGGCGLALACDMRWSTPTARFAITPARLGLAYGVADTRRLVHAIGLSRAKEMLFTARTVDALTALDWGLTDRVVPADDMTTELAAFADAIGSAAPYTIAATKIIAWRVAEGATQDDTQTKALFADSFAGPDFAEGYRAFLEKRPPRFT